MTFTVFFCFTFTNEFLLFFLRQFGGQLESDLTRFLNFCKIKRNVLISFAVRIMMNFKVSITFNNVTFLSNCQRTYRVNVSMFSTFHLNLSGYFIVQFVICIRSRIHGISMTLLSFNFFSLVMVKSFYISQFYVQIPFK